MRLLDEASDHAEKILSAVRNRNSSSSEDIDASVTATLKALELLSHENQNIEFINWKRVRSIIEHENTLINYRIRWMLLSHAAAFTLVGVLLSIQNDNPQTDSVQRAASDITTMIMYVIFAFGVFISLNALSNLRRASKQLKRVTIWWYETTARNALAPNLGDSGQTDTQRKSAAMRAAIEDVDRRHPPLHHSRYIQVVEETSGIGVLLLRFKFWDRVESIPVFFIGVWIILAIFLYINDKNKELWNSVLMFLDRSGTMIGIIVVLSTVLVASTMSLLFTLVPRPPAD